MVLPRQDQDLLQREGLRRGRPLASGAFQGRFVSVVSRTADEKTWLVTAASDTEPGQTLIFDRKTHILTPQYKIREKLPRQDLAEMKAVTFKSSEGLELS